MNMDREIVDLYVDDIIPNRFQPREIFDDKALKELSASIKEHGVIQPIIVRKIGDKYEIIAGERRYKASVMAGLTKIPAIIRNLDDKESSKVALLENLQRRDLTAIEEARTYQKILDLDSMTQEELGKTMGKSQAAIANKLRLLSLPDEVQESLLTGQISERHARSLLNIKDKQKQIEMLNKIIATRMTVRELDTEIKALLDDGTSSSDSDSGTEKIISSIGAEQNPVSIPDMNPVVKPYESSINVDINEIKAQTSDIIDQNKPAVDLNQLLKVDQPLETQKEMSNDETKSYKFVPPLEEEESSTDTSEEQPEDLAKFDFLAKTPIYFDQNNSSDLPKEEPLNPIQPLANENMEPILIDEIENLDEEQKSNSSQTVTYQPFANTESLLNEFRQNNGQPPIIHQESAIKEPILVEESTIPEETSPKITDLKTAINTVRELVRNLEDNGFVVDLDEMDFENKYQISIKIDKNK